jgi:hypothetical protein
MRLLYRHRRAPEFCCPEEKPFRAALSEPVSFCHRTCLERFGLSESDLKSLQSSDPRKVAIAGSFHQRTTTPQGWTAERLQMKSAANVSQQLSRVKKAAKPKIKTAKPAI